MMNKLIFLFMMYFLNIMFLNFNNPLIMGMILFLQTLMMILLMGKIYYSFWFSYIIFLVMIGGLFILFIYMISLTYNNMLLSMKFYLKYFMITLISTFLIFILKKSMYMKNEEINNLILYKENINNSMKFFNFPNNFINLMMIIYLFIMMIIVIKITNFFSGPIRNLE